MSGPAQRLREERGFTLVEVLAATVFLIVGVLAMLAMVDSANKATAGNQNRAFANNLARQVQETVRQLPFASVNSGGIVSALQNFQLPDGTKPLADSQPVVPGWQIDARVRPSDSTSAIQTFTVTSTVCSVDDSKDGYGATHSGSITWCNSNTGGSPVDSQPDDYKRVEVKITSPSGSGVFKPVTMSTIVGNNRLSGGAGSGAPVERAILQSPLCGGCNATAWNLHEQIAPCFHFTSTVGTDNCNPTYNGAPGTNISAVPIKTIWETPPASVQFYLIKWANALPYGPTETLLGAGTVDPTNSSIFNFTWALNNTYPTQTPDAGYSIKAVAYDGGGTQIGMPQVLSLWLNRFIPDMRAMGTPIAGKDTLFSGMPEIEWLPTTTAGRIDYDFTSYKVYRGATLICTLSSVPLTMAFIKLTIPPNYGHIMTDRCQDTTAPASGSVTYTVRLVSYSPDGQLAGTEGGNVQTSANVNATPVNNRPNAPTAFAASWVKDVNNNWIVRFTWTKPSGTTGDPDAGDCVMNYRIYKASSTAATAPTFTQGAYRTGTGVGSVTAPCYATGSTVYTTDYVQVAGPYATGGPPTNIATKFFIVAVDSKLNESVIAAGATCGGSCVTLNPHA